MKRILNLSTILGLASILTLSSFTPLARAADSTISINIQRGSSEDKPNQPANIGWLAQELRDKGWNVILSPEIEGIPIAELKLKNAGVNLVAEAITIATGGSVRATVRQEDTLFLVGGKKSGRQLEAFNMSGYLAQIPPEKQEQALNTLENIVLNSLLTLQEGQLAQQPGFRFYSDAKILVVIGTPEALEVTRKIVQALPGQSQQKQSGKQVDLLDVTN
jgi:hypothetical protein